MNILPNGVAVCGQSRHAEWCATEGLVHDKWMAGILTKLIEDHKIQTVIDAGANIGTLTRPMLDAGARIHAFEPNAEAMACLVHNCPEALVYEAGLSDEVRALRIIRCPNAGASYLTELSDEKLNHRVIVMPLDTYAISPGLIKGDVEGFEVHLLRGARHMIAAHKPLLVLEVNQEALKRAGESEASLLETLLSYDYVAEILQPDCDWGDPQFDVIARPI